MIAVQSRSREIGDRRAVAGEDRLEGLGTLPLRMLRRQLAARGRARTSPGCRAAARPTACRPGRRSRPASSGATNVGARLVGGRPDEIEDRLLGRPVVPRRQRRIVGPRGRGVGEEQARGTTGRTASVASRVRRERPRWGSETCAVIGLLHRHAPLSSEKAAPPVRFRQRGPHEVSSTGRACFWAAASICSLTASRLKLAPFCIGGKSTNVCASLRDLLLHEDEAPELVAEEVERTPGSRCVPWEARALERIEAQVGDDRPVDLRRFRRASRSAGR